MSFHNVIHQCRFGAPVRTGTDPAPTLFSSASLSKRAKQFGSRASGRSISGRCGGSSTNANTITSTSLCTIDSFTSTKISTINIFSDLTMSTRNITSIAIATRRDSSTSQTTTGNGTSSVTRAKQGAFWRSMLGRCGCAAAIVVVLVVLILLLVKYYHFL